MEITNYEIKGVGAGPTFYAMRVAADLMIEASMCARPFFGADHIHSVNEVTAKWKLKRSQAAVARRRELFDEFTQADWSKLLNAEDKVIVTRDIYQTLNQRLKADVRGCLDC